MNVLSERSFDVAGRDTGLSALSEIRPPSRSIFHQTWWLDAASNGAWAEAQVVWDRQVVAVLPYVCFRKHAVTRVTMPPYTRVLGPLLALPPAKPVQRIAQLRKVVSELLRQLPPHDWFLQTLRADSADAIGFALNGWSVEQSFTFRSPPEVSIDAAWSLLEAKTRNQIRQCRQRMQVEWHGDVDRLIRMLRQQFDGGGPRNRHDDPTLSRILHACLARGQASIVAAVNDAGQDAAHAALIWDEEAMYFWVSARHPAHAVGSTLSLLVWEAVALAKQRGLAMDFDGFATPAAGGFVAGFGGVPVVRPLLSRRNARCDLLHALRNAAATLRARAGRS